MPISTRALAIAAAAAFGTLVGLAIYTASYAEATSYLSDDSRACANCHVMVEQYKGWERGSHRAVAACNDCHTPSGFVGKWTTKALNGWHHSVAFTTDDFHEPIRINARNLAITEQACRDCHATMVAELEHPASEPIECVRCHRDAGHLH